MGRRTLVLVIAVALAAISGYAIYQYLTGVEDDIRADISEVGVYRADEPIPSGTPGEEARPLISEQKALKESVVFDGSQILCTGPAGANAGEDPNGEFGCPNNPSDLNVVLDGKIAAGPISAGQLISTDSFSTAADLQQRLKDAIAPGKVAISIDAGISSASGGFIRPGDNVNILASATLAPLQFLELISNEELRNLLVEIEIDPTATETDETDTGETTETAEDQSPTNLSGAIAGSYDITQTILQNVQVLAVGADTRPAPLETGLMPEAGVIVFEVTPEEAELIEYARQYTSIALSLLPSGDYIEYDAQPIVVDDIFLLLDRISAELGQVDTGDGN